MVWVLVSCLSEQVLRKWTVVLVVAAAVAAA